MDTTQKIIDQISELPPAEQEKVMAAVQELLYPPDPEVEKAWAEEARRRLDEIKEGKVETIPGEQVEREIREKYFE